MKTYINAIDYGMNIISESKNIKSNEFIKPSFEELKFIQMTESYYELNTKYITVKKKLKTTKNRIKQIIDICSIPLHKIMDLKINIMEIQKIEYSH